MEDPSFVVEFEKWVLFRSVETGWLEVGKEFSWGRLNKEK